MTENVKDYYRQIIEQNIGDIAHELLFGRITQETARLMQCDCPHHQSQSKKSLHIMLDKQGWYCFGCGVGGDVLQLVEFIQSGTVTAGQSGPMPESHKQARDFLAHKIGLPLLSEFGLSPEELEKAEAERAYEGRVKLALTELAKLYHQCLKENPEVLTWLKEHYSISDDSIDELQIGYADNSHSPRRILMEAEHKFTPQELLATGAFLPTREGTLMPFFQKRLIFPYWSRGSVGFMIGRKTPWTENSKYEQSKYKKLLVHSEERPYIAPCINNGMLYNEDVLLTGPDYIVITEGVTDCLALMQAGFPAISPVTVRLRKDDWQRIIPKLRQVKTVYICQDNELSQAGLKGALQSAGILSRNGINVKLAILPPGKFQNAAREELRERFQLASSVTPKELKQKLADCKPEVVEHAENLLEAAKIDVNEFFRSGQGKDDFAQLLKSAVTPLEFGIGSLPDDASGEELNELLEPLLEEIAFYSPLEQDRLLRMVQERIGKTVTQSTLKAQIREISKKRKSEARREKTQLMAQRPENIQGKRLQIELPNHPRKSDGIIISGRTESEFAEDLFRALAEVYVFFNYSGNIVQIDGIRRRNQNGLDFQVTGFNQVKPAGFVIDVEQYLDTGIYMSDESGNPVFVRDSMYRGHAENALTSDAARRLLPHIKGIAEISLPYFVNNELKFTPPGYDPGVGYWTDTNAPEIVTMPVSCAKETLVSLFSEFCFLEPELDIARAVAYILTPMLRVIVGENRAMIFFASGNRPGVGKDYLLGLAPLIYTGREPGFYAPCCDDDEYRKQIFSICAAGERFFLTSNLKGHLSSPALEQAATLPFFSGRTLGKSEQKTYPNLAVYGLSSNGLTISEDMERRILDIRLEFYEEDIKKRRFKRDLYEYVKANRPKILSALMSLVVHWYEQGAKPGPSGVPNFVTWSQIISGILPECGFANPFDERREITASMKSSGNHDEDNLKKLCAEWYTTFGFNQVSAADLRKLAQTNELFQYFDFEQRRYQVIFSKMLQSHAGRYYGGYKICVDASSKYNRYFLEAVKKK